MPSRRWSRVVIVLSIASVLCSCGGSDQNSSSADTTVTPESATTVPATTVPAVPQTTAVPLTNVVPTDVPLPDVTCADIDPPKDFRLSTAASAHVTWTAVMAPPPETSPNQLNLEISADQGITWKRTSFMRISLTSALVLDTKPGTTILVRAQLYRAYKNPCVTEYSTAVELKIT